MSRTDDGGKIISNVRFVWNREKEASNFKKHRVSFAEAATAYFDDAVCLSADRVHGDRGHYVGRTAGGDVVLTVYAEKVDEESLRIVSARPASGADLKEYQHQFDPKGRHRARSPSNSSRGGFLAFAKRHGIPRKRAGRRRIPRVSKLRATYPTHAARQERGWSFLRASYLSTVGERLSAFRLLNHLSQGELAKKTGIEQATLSHLEHDQVVLGARRAEVLAKALGVPPEILLWGGRR